MAVRRAGQKVFDWAKLSSNVPEYGRGDFLAFKGRYEVQKAKMNVFSEKPNPIDWNFYKSNVSNTQLVENFRKQYESLNIPYPKDTMSEIIAAREKVEDAKAAVAIQEAEVEKREFAEELAKLKAQKPYEDMTLEEYVADKPEIVEMADRNAYNSDWYIPKKTY